MAVHIPLSLEAQLEARVLMMSTNNILSPSNGKPIIVPSQDMVLGIYYLSQSMPTKNENKSNGYFSNVAEIEQGLETKSISLHSTIICRFETVDEKGNKVLEKYKSTAGRFILSSILPKHHKIKFSLIDRILSKKQVSEIIDMVYRYCGQKETVIYCDKIKALGF